jgi:hypothetical protein
VPVVRAVETKIDLQVLLDSTRQPLDLVETADSRAAIERYLQSSTLYLERATLGLLSTLATAMSAGANGLIARVEHRPDGPWFVVDLEQEAEPEPDLNLDLSPDRMEKVTVRLPEDLKDLIDQLAREEGFSANNWYIRELARATARSAARGAAEGMTEAFRQAFPGNQARRTRRHRDGT